jgi:hypothetical protein
MSPNLPVVVINKDCCYSACFMGLQVPMVTTIAGAKATALALKAMKAGPLAQVPLQEYFPDYKDESNYLMVGMPQQQAEPARR